MSSEGRVGTVLTGLPRNPQARAPTACHVSAWANILRLSTWSFHQGSAGPGAAADGADDPFLDKSQNRMQALHWGYHRAGRCWNPEK